MCSKVKVNVGILQVVELILGFLDSSGPSLFLAGGVLPLVLTEERIVRLENILTQLG